MRVQKVIGEHREWRMDAYARQPTKEEEAMPHFTNIKVERLSKVRLRRACLFWRLGVLVGCRWSLNVLFSHITVLM
jgi:hypothetical protein